ncbi:hypothetical protein [Tardiphaga sp. 862_B3_N1_1]|uniref:hypothetical protein n=1 Tax=Tardiphaga sp. 862_B3_N1_1 TaxID=3240763 RepID=UPI003F8990FB
MKQNKKVRSGNEIIVLFDGQQVGMCRSVRGSDDYGPDAASGIGDIHVAEWVPTQARHSLSVSNMVLIKSNMMALGLTPENGDAVLQGLVFDLEMYAKADGQLLRKYLGVSYASGDIDIQAHQIVVASGQFMALDVTGKGA